MFWVSQIYCYSIFRPVTLQIDSYLRVSSTLVIPFHSLNPPFQRLVSCERSVSLTLIAYYLTRFIPIVALALVFNITNAVGFTYASV